MWPNMAVAGALAKQKLGNSTGAVTPDYTVAATAEESLRSADEIGK